MDLGVEDVGGGGYQSKTQSLRDKMKKKKAGYRKLINRRNTRIIINSEK